MNRVLILLLSCIVVSSVLAAPAAAQAAGNQTATPTTATSTPTPTATPASTPTPTATPASTPTPTDTEASAPPGANDSTAVLVVDRDVKVTSVRYDDDELVITFESSEFKPVSIAPQPEQGNQAGSVSSRSHVLDKGKTTVRVQTPGGVSLWTDESVSNGRIHFLRKPSNSIVSGPYDGKDVRDSAIGAGSAVGFAVLFTAVRAKVSGGRDGERVA